MHYDTPRFGIILSVKTVKKIMKDQEYFANYGYQLEVGHGPRWYRRLFRQYAKENPTQNNLLRLDELNKAEKNYNLTDTSENTL